MILLSVLSTLASARSTGIANRAIGCNSCHGAVASATTTVAFGAAPLTVLPGEVVALTLTVSSTNAAHIAGGLSVEATGGSFTAGSNTKVLSGDITHTAPVFFVAGSATFDFTWTAPSTEGLYTLTSAGNAVNYTGTAAGDGWNIATAIIIDVDDGCDDIDNDGVDTCNGDCDDNDASSHPGAPEICDGVDNNCDGTPDNDAVDATSWYLDSDGDGYGAGTATIACDAPANHVDLGSDCNDNDNAFYPSAPETDCADPNDYNCDGLTGFSDSDSDGWAACLECDDDDASSYPGAPEICDGADNDCDGTPDNDAVDAVTVYLDADGDGYGTEGEIVTCTPLPVHVLVMGDCNDSDETVHPSATEQCDPGNIDEDCDGLSDDDDDSPVGMTEWFTDTDRDGYGGGAAMLACDAPPDAVALSGDCDDTNVDRYPGASEYCNGLDEDCDLIPDNDAVDAIALYLDSDGDGYGAGTALFSCEPPDGYVELDGDCDDSRIDFYPGAPETDCEDPNDYNCDGSVGTDDIDSDGWMACLECDDSNAQINPDAAEVCDGIDNDCEGSIDIDAIDATTFYRDADLDGHGTETDSIAACTVPDGYSALSDDCDDADASVYPGAEDLTCDGIDLDCDPAPDTDPSCASETPAEKEPDVGCGCRTGAGAPLGWMLLGMLFARVRARKR